MAGRVFQPERRQVVDQVVAEAATTLLAGEPSECRKLIQGVLSKIAEAMRLKSEVSLAVFEFGSEEGPGRKVAMTAEISHQPCSNRDLFCLDIGESQHIARMPFPELWQSVHEKGTTIVQDSSMPDYLGALVGGIAQSFVCVPMKAPRDASLDGVLFLWSPHQLIYEPTLLRSLEQLGQTFGNAIRRGKSSAELEHLRGLAMLLSEISRDFINLPTAELPEAIQLGLQRLGEFLPADTCSIYEVSDDFKATARRFNWLASGALPEPPSTLRVTLELFPWFARCYREGTPLAIGDLYDIPSYATAERALVSKLRAKSFLAVPMRVSGRTIGHVGFGTQREHRRWSAAQVEQMRTLGDLFAAAMERCRKSTALADSENRYETIVEDQTHWILRWLPDGTRTFVNSSYCARFQMTSEELLGTSFLSDAPSEDRALILRKIAGLSPDCPVVTDQHPVHGSDGSVRWEEWTDRGFFDARGRLIELQSAGHDITEQRTAQERERTRHHEFQQQLIHRQETERARIARELHDELGQSLTGMRMQLRNLQKRLPNGESVSAEDLAGLLEAVDQTIPEIRRICAELRPSTLDHLGIEAAMEWHMERYEEVTGLKCHCEFAVPQLVANAGRDINLFRIFQELLNNVAKHAQGTQVWVSLRETPTTLKLEVRDDGRGITPTDRARAGHFGLLGVTERVTVVHGEMEIVSAPGEGTCVKISLPIIEESNNDHG